MAQTLRLVREDALNSLSAVITAMWGDRCARIEGGCAKCVAWTSFDLIATMTDGSTLDDVDDYLGVADRFNLPKST